MSQDHLTSDRLLLRPFEAADLDDFADLHSDPEVMEDLGGPITRAAAKDKLMRYMASDKWFGYGRKAVFCDGVFAGYVGVMHRDVPEHTLGPHNEIGWRLMQSMWGRGIATEAAVMCLRDYFATHRPLGVLSYALPQNIRSHAVMERLGFQRAEELDFVEDDPDYGLWTGHVWRVPAALFGRRD